MGGPRGRPLFYMPRLIIASTNPVKIAAAENGFRRMFPDQPLETQAINVASGVSAQPRSDLETLTGALNRAANAQQAVPDADYWFGIEGGLEDDGAEMLAFAWIVVQSRDRVGKGRTGAFCLPRVIVDLVRQGKELGEADDLIFGQSNSKQAAGAVGLLTDNVINRARLYEHAVILALIPFKNETLYAIGTPSVKTDGEPDPSKCHTP